MRNVLQELATCVPCWLLTNESSLAAHLAGTQVPGSNQQVVPKRLVSSLNASSALEGLPEHLKLHSMHQSVAETVDKLLQLSSAYGITCFASIKTAVWRQFTTMDSFLHFPLLQCL
jgi:hypothetical protein